MRRPFLRSKHRSQLVSEAFLPTVEQKQGKDEDTYPISPVACVVALALRDKVVHHGVDGNNRGC